LIAQGYLLAVMDAARSPESDTFIFAAAGIGMMEFGKCAEPPPFSFWPQTKASVMAKEIDHFLN
jgi:hypothetical protein